jgi:hypothetical protein
VHSYVPSTVSWGTATLSFNNSSSISGSVSWAGNVIAPTYGGTGVNNGTNTLTLAGNVTHAGAYAQTITATATTSVTLPTSGTLVSSVTALPGAVTGTPSSTTYLRGDGSWASLGSSVTTFSAGTTGFTPSTATSGAVTLAGTLATTNGGTGLTSFTANGVVYASSTSALATGSGLVFDGTNLGLGVTPSAWAVYKSFDSGSCSFNTAGVQGELTSNGYFNNSSTWIYKSTGFANRYVQNLSATGVHAWFNASSGTAGNAISFTQAMTLDNSGNLILGATSGSGKLNVTGGRTYLSTSAGDSYILNLRNPSYTNGCFLGSPGENMFAVSAADGTEFMRIDSSGNLGLGVTPSSWYSGFKVFELASKGNAITALNGEVDLFCNAVNTGSGYIYGTNGSASHFQMSGNSYAWYIAASGTAGNAVSFTQAMTLDGAARLIVNGSSAGTNQNMLTLNGQASWSVGPSLGNGNFYVIGYSSGTGVYVTNGGTSWTGTSDGTLKNVISTINSGLQTITALKPTIYSWKSDTENTPYAGFIAQEVQTVLPNIVDTDQHGKLGIRHSELIPYLVSAIQELNAEIQSLKAEIAALKGA